MVFIVVEAAKDMTGLAALAALAAELQATVNSGYGHFALSSQFSTHRGGGGGQCGPPLLFEYSQDISHSKSFTASISSSRFHQPGRTKICQG
jgi:hypothetical protein